MSSDKVKFDVFIKNFIKRSRTGIPYVKENKGKVFSVGKCYKKCRKPFKKLFIVTKSRSEVTLKCTTKKYGYKTYTYSAPKKLAFYFKDFMKV